MALGQQCGATAAAGRAAKPPALRHAAAPMQRQPPTRGAACPQRLTCHGGHCLLAARNLHYAGHEAVDREGGGRHRSRLGGIGAAPRPSCRPGGRHLHALHRGGQPAVQAAVRVGQAAAGRHRGGARGARAARQPDACRCVGRGKQAGWLDSGRQLQHVCREAAAEPGLPGRPRRVLLTLCPRAARASPAARRPRKEQLAVPCGARLPHLLRRPQAAAPVTLMSCPLFRASKLRRSSGLGSTCTRSLEGVFTNSDLRRGGAGGVGRAARRGRGRWPPAARRAAAWGAGPRLAASWHD